MPILVLGRAHSQTIPPLSPDSFSHASGWSNLSIQFKTRFDRFGALDDLVNGIHASDEAIARSLIVRAEETCRLRNLGVLPVTQCVRFGITDDIIKAIDASGIVVGPLPPHHADRAGILQNAIRKYEEATVALATNHSSRATVLLLQASLFMAHPTSYSDCDPSMGMFGGAMDHCRGRGSVKLVGHQGERFTVARSGPRISTGTRGEVVNTGV
ncbi:hypothetical protein Q9L58_008705 [Maublancomyces gigas]|uniref:Uncharacterized protein n=1 Tax=Discina gigas TaxID=1032678 RepID=A0ABR3G8Z5_9PEZI